MVPIHCLRRCATIHFARHGLFWRQRACNTGMPPPKISGTLHVAVMGVNRIGKGQLKASYEILRLGIKFMNQRTSYSNWRAYSVFGIIILLLTISKYLLIYMGVPYTTPGGSYAFKFHPSSILIFVTFLLIMGWHIFTHRPCGVVSSGCDSAPPPCC